LAIYPDIELNVTNKIPKNINISINAKNPITVIGNLLITKNIIRYPNKESIKVGQPSNIFPIFLKKFFMLISPYKLPYLFLMDLSIRITKGYNKNNRI